MKLATTVLLLLLCGSALAQEHKVGVNKYVLPVLPAIALQAHVASDVVMDLTLNTQGEVIAVDFVSAHPMLKDAALVAIKKWRFVCLDCRPGEEYRHRFTFSWKIFDSPENCEMFYRRGVLELPNRLTVEQSGPCISPRDCRPASKTVRTGWFHRKTYVSQCQ